MNKEIGFPEELADELGYLINGRPATEETILKFMERQGIKNITKEKFNEFVEEHRANRIEKNRVFVKKIPEGSSDFVISVLLEYREKYKVKKKEERCLISFLEAFNILYENIELLKSASGKVYNKNFEKIFSSLEDKLSFNFGSGKLEIYQKGMQEYNYKSLYTIIFTAPFYRNEKFVLVESEIVDMGIRANNTKKDLEEIKKFCSKEYVENLINTTVKELEECSKILNSGDSFQREIKTKILR